ncbi:MAG: ornithine cyclodeaminase family protein [Phycisphaerae bacterium]|nr:ornithine cyclodeaminase family protein [Phycisphaerae bacterium]
MQTDQLLYLSNTDVEQTEVSMIQIIEALEAMYFQKGLGKVEMPSKIGIHTQPNALIHAMPAYIENTGAAGMKWVSAYPENHKYNKPQISGLIILNDNQTGIPYCLMDCSWVTAKRTGAKTAVTASIFAKKDSKYAGIIGCGVQGRSNLEALTNRFDLELVHVFDTNKMMAEKYAEEMSQLFSLEIKVVDTPEQAVRHMDIIVTAGPIIKEPTPVIEFSWLKPGAFAAPVDFDSYWKAEVLSNADIFITDDTDQLFYYQTVGYFKYLPPKENVCDLGSVTYNKNPKRQNDEQIIFAMNLGLALDDMAVAPLIYNAAIQKNIGTPL